MLVFSYDNQDSNSTEIKSFSLELFDYNETEKGACDQGVFWKKALRYEIKGAGALV